MSFIQRPSVGQPARHLHALEVDEQRWRGLLQLARRSHRHPADWARSDDDQRHRLVINGTVNTSMAPATTVWQRLSHGFQLSSLFQSYSSLPLNITSGVTSLQGTTGRPFADGTTSVANFDVRSANLISRNAGIGSDFFSVSLRVSRGVRDRLRRQAGGAGRSLQPDESRQRADPQCELRAKRLSDESVVQLQSDHCRRRPENVTVRAPARLLKIACHDATKPRSPRTAPRMSGHHIDGPSGPHRTVRSRCPRARMPIRPSPHSINSSP